MIDSLLYSIIGGVLIFIMLNTDAVYEYTNFLNIPILNYYKKSKNAGIDQNLFKFLLINYNNFLTKLLSCPYCLSFWSALLISFFTDIKYFGLNYLTNIIIYCILIKIKKYE